MLIRNTCYEVQSDKLRVLIENLINQLPGKSSVNFRFCRMIKVNKSINQNSNKVHKKPINYEGNSLT